jgi:hypothetical protein
MTLSDPNRLLRAFGLARLAVAALLLAIGPLLPEDLMPDANRPVLALTLLEPIMIAFLGVIVGGIVIAMYLPIFDLISKLAN